jgi:hypothetical protein
MTDIADLQRKAQAAREFTVKVGAAAYTLRLPTEHEKRLAVLRARGALDGEDPASTEVIIRALVEAALVRWDGVTCAMLAPGAGPEPAELLPGAAALLLDNQPETAHALALEFIERSAQRQQHAQAAEKN